MRKIKTNLILESAVILPLSGLLRVVESKNNKLFIDIYDRTLFVKTLVVKMLLTILFVFHEYCYGLSL